MAQCCDLYSKKSLMGNNKSFLTKIGNWYEEREAPNQPFHDL